MEINTNMGVFDNIRAYLHCKHDDYELISELSCNLWGMLLAPHAVLLVSN
jgi:hypothetical protein